MTMCEPSQPTLWPETELLSMSSREGSRARTSAWLASGPGSEKEPAADYTPKSSDLLATYDLASSSWRTSQTCLLALVSGEADGLAEFSETWPRSGMMQSGTVYRRETLARPTSEIVSGLWPTPAAKDWKDCGAPSEMLRKSPTLGALLLAPTPRKSRGYTAYSTEGYAPSLTEWISGQRGPANNGQKPNPSFVEWMMGFPIGWGELPPAETP